MSNQKKNGAGIPGYVKAKTLRKLGLVFFDKVEVLNSPGLTREVLLYCCGMKVLSMKEIAYEKNFSSTQYALLISDFLQAFLEPYGLKVGRPIPEKDGGFTYLICR